MADSVPYGYCHCGCGERSPLSAYTDRSRGYITDKPLRFINGHQNRGRCKPLRWVAEDRGFSTPCWIWQLALTTNGYGHISVRASGYVGSAHRYVYAQTRGEIPAGAHLDHLCRVRACVNPDHIEVVTCAENARRGDNAKLTYADIEEICRLRGRGLTQREVAVRFGVVRQTISDIERGRTWAAPGGVVTSRAAA